MAFWDRRNDLVASGMTAVDAREEKHWQQHGEKRVVATVLFHLFFLPVFGISWPRSKPARQKSISATAQMWSRFAGEEEDSGRGLVQSQLAGKEK